jgi:hypothetical protein
VDELDEFAAGVDSNLVARAFFSLPERWQWVLWQTEVEGHAPGDVAHQLDMAPGAVAALSYRARKALSEAYLEVHLVTRPSGRCRETVEHLPGYVRRSAPTKARRAVEAHLATCESCRVAEAELRDLNRSLRESLVPAIAGIPLLSYLVARKATKVLRWAAGSKLASGSMLAGAAVMVSLPLLLPSAEPLAGASERESRPAPALASFAARSQPGMASGATTIGTRHTTGPSTSGSHDDPAVVGADRVPTAHGSEGIPATSIDLPGLTTLTPISLPPLPAPAVVTELLPGVDLTALVAWLQATGSVGPLPLRPILSAIEELIAGRPTITATVGAEPTAGTARIGIDNPYTGHVDASVSLNTAITATATQGSAQGAAAVEPSSASPPAPPAASVPTTVAVTAAPATSSAPAPSPTLTTASTPTTTSLLDPVSSVVSGILQATTTSP